jgi:hypothetical protein
MGSTGFPDPDTVAAVQFKSRADVCDDATARGTKGVRLKSKVPWTCAHADTFGLMHDPRSSFNVISAWGMSRTQRWMGKFLSTLQRSPAIK